MLHTEQHLIEDHPNRPYICLRVVGGLSEYFRGHVQGGAKHGVGVLFRGEELGEPEVCDFDLSVMEKDICEFEISMHDLMFD